MILIIVIWKHLLLWEMLRLVNYLINFETILIIFISKAMRDPIFYRLHSFIDDLFNRHKARLTPYGESQLTFPGITVNSVDIGAERGRPNVVITHWKVTDLDLAKGLDFAPRGDIRARFTHLQHYPFKITVKVTNNSGSDKIGMVRVFIAPKFKERGQRFSFDEQRRFMVETDKFTTKCKLLYILIHTES